MAELSQLDQVCTWAASNLTSFWIPAAVGAVGGVVGGRAECATHIRIVAGKVVYDKEVVDAAAIQILRRSSALIGWAGAWAVMFIFVSTRWWNSEADNSAMPIFVLTLSVAAGFGARRLLPDLADKLKKQIEETNLKVEEVEKHVSAAVETTNRIDLLSRARATQATANASVADIFKSIEELRGLMKSNAKDREVVVVLGNLQTKAEQLPAAIGALTKFVDAKIAANENDVDLADVLFNRACYYTKLWKHPSTEQHAADEYRKRAIRDLEISFKLSPPNRPDAALDKDLGPLMQDPDYKAMLGSLDAAKS